MKTTMIGKEGRVNMEGRESHRVSSKIITMIHRKDHLLGHNKAANGYNKSSNGHNKTSIMGTTKNDHLGLETNKPLRAQNTPLWVENKEDNHYRLEVKVIRL